MAKGEIKVKYQAGSSIDSCCKDALRLSKLLNVCISFDFNGIEVFIKETSDITNSFEKYKNMLNFKIPLLIL